MFAMQRSGDERVTPEVNFSGVCGLRVKKLNILCRLVPERQRRPVKTLSAVDLWILIPQKILVGLIKGPFCSELIEPFSHKLCDNAVCITLVVASLRLMSNDYY